MICDVCDVSIRKKFMSDANDSDEQTFGRDSGSIADCGYRKQNVQGANGHNLLLTIIVSLVLSTSYSVCEFISVSSVLLAAYVLH